MSVLPTRDSVPSRLELPCGALAGERGTVLNLNADGSTCSRGASRFVAVAGVELAVCGHHVDRAAERAADRAGVELADSTAPTTAGGSRVPSDPFDRRPSDYDVSDHPAYVPGESP